MRFLLVLAVLKVSSAAACNAPKGEFLDAILLRNLSVSVGVAAVRESCAGIVDKYDFDQVFGRAAPGKNIKLMNWAADKELAYFNNSDAKWNESTNYTRSRIYDWLNDNSEAVVRSYCERAARVLTDMLGLSGKSQSRSQLIKYARSERMAHIRNPIACME